MWLLLILLITELIKNKNYRYSLLNPPFRCSSPNSLHTNRGIGAGAGASSRHRFTLDDQLISACSCSSGHSSFLALEALRTFYFFLILLKFFIFLLAHRIHLFLLVFAHVTQDLIWVLHGWGGNLWDLRLNNLLPKLLKCYISTHTCTLRLSNLCEGIWTGVDVKRLVVIAFHLWGLSF